MKSRSVRSSVAIALAVGIITGFAIPAGATLADTPDATWMTNGQVYAIAQSGNTIYVGGKFSSIRACPPGSSCPGGTLAALNIAAVDATTGVAIRTFSAPIEGDGATVYALAVNGNDLYIGGRFTSVDGSPRLNLAAVDLATGALDTAVDHQIGLDTTDRIRGLLASGGKVYAAGYFTSVDGLARKHLAAFDSDGSLSSTWKPRTSGLARTLLATCDGTSIIAGGSFRSAAGSTGAVQPRATLAMFDATTGTLENWTPDNAQIPNGVNAFDLAGNCDRLFVGYGGSNALYAFDLTDDFGDLIFAMKTGGNVQTVALRGDRVLFGGHFTQVSVLCGISGNENEQRIRFAMADLDGCVRDASGNDLDGWTPSFEGKFYGPWEIFPTGQQVWVGGQFTNVSGSAQYMLARFTDTP